MNKNLIRVPVISTLRDLLENRSIRERVLYYAGDWWYQEPPLAGWIANASLPPEVTIREQGIEYLPAISFEGHWVPKGDRMLSVCETMYAVIALAAEGRHLLGDGERIVAHDGSVGDAAVIWRLSGQYVLNAFRTETMPDAIHRLSTGR